MAAVAAVLAGALATGADGTAAVPAHGRAWELVSSYDTASAPPPVTPLAIDAAGDRIVYSTSGPVAGAPAGGLLATSIGVRGAGGWQSSPVGYPYSVPQVTLPLTAPAGASGDLSTWVWNSALPLVPGAPAAPATGWYRGGPSGTPTLLGEGGELATLVGLSDDAQRIVFQTPTPLLPADAGRLAGGQVYEYAGATLRLVGVDGGGAPLSACGVLAGSPSASPNPVSDDARRVFLTSPEVPCDGGTARVYLREDGSTTEISASRCTRSDCSAAADVHFMGATPSGAVAWLATTQQLTDDDLDASQDLYRYDVSSGALSRVSNGAAVAAAVVATRAYPSDDGSRVYFLANGMLVAGQGSNAAPNLYVADAGGLHFVATLDQSDDWPLGTTFAGKPADVVATPGSGRRIAFATLAQLRPDDTDLAPDLYLYDAGDGTLARVSGVAGSGNGDFPASSAVGSSSRPPFMRDASRSLSDDGRRVFFSTRESLLPDDGDVAVDVYEWLDGDLGLISPSSGADDAHFFGASPDGRTAFLATDERLVARDDDAGDYDLYAARLGGGFPDPPAVAPECVCPVPSTARLTRPDPASLTQRERRSRRFGVRRPGRVALRRMAAAGRLSLVVVAARPGRISATATARLGGRARVVARGAGRLRRAGSTQLALPLAAAARRRLANGRALALRVRVRHSRLGRAANATLRLRLPGAR